MKNQTFKAFLERWENVITNHDPKLLNELLDDSVVFYSPVVHTPQEGKFITSMYLLGASAVLKEGFTYHNKVIEGLRGVLEFTCVIDDIIVDGIDIIQLNEEGKILEFKVMIRPLKAIQKVHEKMGLILNSLQ